LEYRKKQSGIEEKKNRKFKWKKETFYFHFHKL
jgi:hypothetical protein